MNTRNQFRRFCSYVRLVNVQARIRPQYLGTFRYENLRDILSLQLQSVTYCLKAKFSYHLGLARRSMSSMASALPVQEKYNNSNGSGNMEILPESVTVIRFKPEDERFKMQIILRNGRAFNFDRASSDTVSNVVTRIATNISKKVKNFNGVVKFIHPSSEEIMNEDETEVKNVFTKALKSPPLKIQVGDEVYDVAFNPPEVYSVKFFGTFMPTLPMFPYRMETSDNFSIDKSVYKWEFSQTKPGPILPPKMKKKSKTENDADGIIRTVKEVSPWSVCGTKLIFTPKKGMEGGYLRFSCTPSNGLIFGKPFSLTLPNPISPLPVKSFLFEQRLLKLAKKSSDKGALRVLSYNALADTYATPEWFISSPADSLDAGYRLPLLNREIQAYQADIICLQEVDEKYFTGNFQPFLKSIGFEGIHTSKIGSTKEGIATFHNPSKLSLLVSYDCFILEHMKTLCLWEKLKTVGKNFIERLEERNTVFHVSTFEVKNCPKNTILLVGNVHLYFHPDADHIRLLQTITCINFLEAKVAQVQKEYPDRRVAVIFCGDFNCTPPFSSFRLLTTGKVEENDEDWTSHSEEKILPGISFSHSLNLTNSHPGEQLTNITTCFEGCLDYIMYQSEYIELCGTCPIPDKEELTRLTEVDEPRKVSLPNFYTPSDHLPLIADFKFKS